MTNKIKTENTEIKEHPFGYLYFKDPLVTLPKVLRSSIKLTSFGIWSSICLISFIGIAVGLLKGLNNGFLKRDPIFSLLWLGIFLAFYTIHHISKTKKSWKNFSSLRSKKDLSNLELNIAEYFEPRSKKIFSTAIDQAKTNNDPLDLTLFKVLLESPEIIDFLNYLELDQKIIRKEFANKIKEFSKDYKISKEPIKETISDLSRISFIEAFSAGSVSIKPYHFLMALFKEPHPLIETLLLKHNIEIEDARHVSSWLRIKNNIVITKGRRRIKHKTMNRAFTAKPTVFLDSYSEDLTDLARYGLLSPLVGHQDEYQGTVNILNQSARNNAVLIGQTGSGRQAIINELARKIAYDNVPKNLYDRRLVSLSVGDMLAGLKTPGELQERLQKVMDEIVASKNIILAIPQIHDIIKAVENQSLSFMSFFGPVFESVNFPLIASTDEKNYHDLIEKRPDLANTFNAIKIQEISRDDAFKYIMREALILSKKENITIGHFAVREAINLSERYLKNRLLPGKAYDLLTQSVEEAKVNKKTYVSRDDVKASLAKSTGIPVEKTGEAEAKELLNLEEKLHQRLIGQEPAVKAVSQTLRQARAGVERRSGPTGVFLFVGPTGVGKTELAKALADIYFGGEDKMLRFDMSEYQSPESIYRLIGKKDHGGLLTEKVKNQPFSLLLLDEFEKAHSDVLNLFLQIFEDGRATDEFGGTVDFSNTIIITTSNAHAILIQEKMKEGINAEVIQKLLRDKLTDVYRPELLNRFDEIIVFGTLSPEELKKIATLKLESLFSRIEEEQGIKLSISPLALNRISELGYDPKNGARPIRRAISKHIKNLIANKVLANELKKGEEYLINLVNDGFVIEDVKS